MRAEILKKSSTVTQSPPSPQKRGYKSPPRNIAPLHKSPQDRLYIHESLWPEILLCLFLCSYMRSTCHTNLDILYGITLTTVRRSTVFCNVAPCSPVEVHRRFGGNYCLHLQGGEASERAVCNGAQGEPIGARRNENPSVHLSGSVSRSDCTAAVLQWLVALEGTWKEAVVA
jgi:hypothetical protein